jgi:nitrite reductase (NO-forming)/hydroxylamine reductase
MPNWGTSGELTATEVDIMARFLQHDPPTTAGMGHEGNEGVWKVLVPVAERPTKQMNIQHRQLLRRHPARFRRDRDDRRRHQEDHQHHQDRLRGAHLAPLALRPLRLHHRPRCQDRPDRPVDAAAGKVAEIKIGLEARSVETSKYKGYEDKLAIAGAYWPPQYVIMDGPTLEPKKIVSTRGMTVDTQEYHPEPRVAAIVASARAPGVHRQRQGDRAGILLVNYEDIDNLSDHHARRRALPA